LKSPKKKPDSQRSLFGEILDWMLAPLLFVWPISIAITHYFATSVAGYPYDQTLREHVAAIARQVKIVDGKAYVSFPSSARAVLRSDELDEVYFHVVTRDGRHLAGDTELPFAEDLLAQADEPGETYFRSAEVNGRDVRVAYQYLADPTLTRDRWVIVEVAETLEKRNQLSNRIIASVILPQFIIIPLAVILVWFGLTQGLRPLNLLRAKIESRRPGDMAEIKTWGVPEEMAPLIDAFNALIERTRRNMAAQQRFIADAAHQLRTPLTGLKTQAQVAMRESDPATLRLALENIAGGVDRAGRLVNQLLTLARAEAYDQTQHTLEPIDLDALLRQVVEDWIWRALEKDIDLGYEPGEPASIHGVEFLLREMINNLIDNALRYTPAGGRVTVRAPRHGDFVVLEVEDSGVGISEHDAELVFEPFYRVDNATTEGSGLGLAIVREIAELHHADVSLRPNPKERGALARVVFPAYEPATAGREGEGPATGPGERPPLPTGFV